MSESEKWRAIREVIGWDDRKALSWLWQDHAPAPDGPWDDFYSALIAVAEWGAARMYDDLAARDDEAIP